MREGKMTMRTKELFLLLLCLACVDSATVHLYVSPTGSDSNDGRQASHPVKTLQHVLNILEHDGFRGNNVFVEMMKGYYYLTSTLRFHNAHTGTLVFRAYQGQEVHVVGGQHISSDLFHHVTDQHVLNRLPQSARGKVLELDLQAAGITDLGNLTSYGFYHLWKAPLEIFINGRPLRLAQWPNLGFTNIRSVPDGQSGRRFTYNVGGRDTQWAQETEPWVYGWWYWSWADSSLPVSKIDAHSHTITLGADSQYGLRVGHYKTTGTQVGFSQQGGYFRVINMLSEIDEPGEYYIDRTNKKAYIWPNTPHQTIASSDTVYGSLLTSCIRVESNVHNLHFEDFTVEGCRHFGFDMTGAKDVTFKNMELKNTGSFGISCHNDCRRVSVLASEFHDVGGGVWMDGGDRATLTRSENVVRDNHMWAFSRCGAIPGDAVHVAGVGCTVAHNHIHHGQYTGIRWAGNEHVIEYNHIHHMCWNASDCGAIHSGREWTWRGNVIRHNHIHHTIRNLPGADVRGIMLDDEYSSVLIEHNVFYENEVHVNIGGGRDNVIRNNVMFDAGKYSMQVDGRGMGTSNSHATTLRQRLAESPYKTSLWQSRYPKLANILSKHPEAPEGNEIYNNVIYNNIGIESVFFGGHNLNRKDYFDVHDNHRTTKQADFWSPSDGDFRFRCESAQWTNAHHIPAPLTVNEVGPEVPTGPHYQRVRRPSPTQHTSRAPVSCDSSTIAPSTTKPQVPYLPDGSGPNTLHPEVPADACWMIVDNCPNHHNAEGSYNDDLGSQTGTEEGCLSRAVAQWNWCGSPADGRVTMIYGKTGAMRLATAGCYMAEYGCPLHGGDHPGIHRDVWAEQHQNAANDEQACLKRAHDQWAWCGSDPQRPYTSIYGPTGNTRTIGGGCWVKLPSCPAHRNLEGFFYDTWAATNIGTDSSELECLDRAQYFWEQCGSHSDAPVTAFYRPTGASHTVP